MPDYIIRTVNGLNVSSEDYEQSEDLNNAIDYVLLNWFRDKANILNRSVSILCPKQNCIMVTISHAGETSDHLFVSVTKSLHTLAMANLFVQVSIHSVNKHTGEVSERAEETIQYK